jgi:RNA methyltransferase, TrmH family
MGYAGVTKPDSALLYVFEMTTALTSPQNPLLKEVRRAASRGELTEDGCVVAEGAHLLEEALASKVEIATVIAADAARAAVESLLSRADHVRVVSVPDAVFAKIASTEHPQGVITLVRLPRWGPQDLVRGTPLIMILDAIQDPGNAGAIVRAAEAFGATGVVFMKGTVSPHNPKCLRASAGSLFRMPVAHDFSPAAMPPLTIFAAMPRAELTLDQADLTGPCAIAVGNEGRGVGPDTAWLSTRIRIPTVGVESLNAAMAAGVMLYEARRQRAHGSA